MEIKNVLVKDIKYAPYNPRKISDDVLSKLKRSIEEFGYIEPIVVNKRTMHVVGGNQRLKVLRQLGIEEVQAVIVDLDDTHEKALNIALNKINGEWDLPLLKDLLLEIDTGEIDTEITGFDMPEIEELMNQFHIEGEEDGFNVDEAVEGIEEPVTKRGDIYLLGRHRLMCGDSTKKEDVERLMDGKKADMLFADPPYGVNYTGGHFHSGDVNIKRQREKLIGDDTVNIYREFLPVVLPFVDGPCYMWFASTKGKEVYNALHESNTEIHALLIWHKVNAKYAAMNAQYKQRHEPCLYFKPKGSTLRWIGPTTESTVWEIKRDAVNEYHPTQKPIALAAKAIKNHDVRVVLDVFGGSGSTLIACEQLNRICYMMEIDPVYCDVIVKRWEEYTGKKAELLR
jgi:DNA modification methylase